MSAPVNDPQRGELRIYLGAAPGVGKTFAMLGEAHRRRTRGTDIVVGLVETHGRAKTADLLQGLEILPRTTITHRGNEFTELDVDAVLARKPQVVLVDELAHTNVAGSRNTKRWQDIDRLLDAGIDVLSTVNIQHLESLNDVVERIAGVRQRETVPDEWVRRAEQIELVDITPEALRRRLAHGNVYAAHKIDAALGNYFRPGNLTALRELALLWVADQVDIALQRYRSDKQITDTWEARERVVVSVTGGLESETLIRRGRRIASRAGAELLVVHVLRGDGLAGAPAHAVGALRKLADDVGATFHTVVGDDVPHALLEFARGANATQLVLGTSRRNRFARLLDEGIGATVVQRSGPIDVHMITHPQAAGRGWRPQRGRSSLPHRRHLIGWTLAVLLPGVVTLLGHLFRDELILSTDVIAYLLTTVLAALVGGLGPALFCAMWSGALFNFFFTEPFYTFTITAQENVVTLVAMVLVGVAVAIVVDRAARRAEEAAIARREATLLSSYARTVLTHDKPVERLLEKVRENFGQDSVSLLEKHGGSWTAVAHSGTTTCTHPEDADIDIPVTPGIHLALRGRPLPAADRGVLEAAANQAFLALRQQRAAAEADQAQRLAETNRLRTAILSAVGHDLRTPLTSIRAALDSLQARDITLSEADRTDLLAVIAHSTDRLAALVDNLLDSSRIATGAVQPLLQPIGYDEVVARALASVDQHEKISIDVDEQLPPIVADVGLLERVIANVIDNALRHGITEPARPVDVNRDGHLAADEPAIALRASTHADTVELRVVDHGPGLPKGTAEKAFAPFQRLGDRDPSSGIGLGLSVAKGFVDAMNGHLTAEDTPGGGLTIVISLPTPAKEDHP